MMKEKKIKKWKERKDRGREKREGKWRRKPSTSHKILKKKEISKPILFCKVSNILNIYLQPQSYLSDIGFAHAQITI